MYEESELGEQGGGVTVSFREIYDELQLTHDEVREMRMELRMITDHESRIRKLEQKVWIVLGLATTVGPSLGALLAQLIPGA